MPYIFLSTASGTQSYNTQESTENLTKIDDFENALLSYDAINKRLYRYTENEGIRSSYLDGSDPTVISIDNLEFFTVDGQNNLIYYEHKLQDRIWIYNITSGENSAVAALSDVNSVKDLDFDSTNGY